MSQQFIEESLAISTHVKVLNVTNMEMNTKTTKGFTVARSSKSL